MKKLLIILCVSVAALLIGSALLAAEGAETPSPQKMEELCELLKEEGKPAFTAEEADAFYEELIPLVEKVTGKKFTQIPKIKLTDRDELGKAISRDFIPQFRNLMKNMNEDQIVQIAESQTKRMTPFFLGKYGVEDKVLYLMPKNLLPLMKLKNIDEQHTQSIIKIVIAHELTHALQDQEVDLGKRLRNLRGLEELDAFNAVIEGHAMFIQDLVGSQLKLNDAVLEAIWRLLIEGGIAGDPLIAMISEMAKVRAEQIYLGGKGFIEYHYKRGGNKRVWEILAAPPTETSMISAPATYSPVRAWKPDYAKILEGLDQYFGEGECNVMNLDIPKTIIRASYANLECDKKEEIISSIVHIQALMVTSTDSSSLGGITIIVLKDNSYGPKLVSSIEETVRNNVERMKESKLYKINKFSIGDLAGIAADVARKMSFTIKPVHGEGVKNIFFRICRGTILLEIFSSNISLTNEQIITIAEEVFRRSGESKLYQEK